MTRGYLRRKTIILLLGIIIDLRLQAVAELRVARTHRFRGYIFFNFLIIVIYERAKRLIIDFPYYSITHARHI